MTKDETIADLLNQIDDATFTLIQANKTVAAYAKLVAGYKQALDNVLDDKERELREMGRRSKELRARPIMNSGEFKLHLQPTEPKPPGLN